MAKRFSCLMNRHPLRPLDIVVKTAFRKDNLPCDTWAVEMMGHLWECKCGTKTYVRVYLGPQVGYRMEEITGVDGYESSRAS